MSNVLTDLSVKEAAYSIGNGAFSARDYLEAHLFAIDKYDPVLDAFLLVMTESALEDADRADLAQKNGEVLRPLHGIPVAIKDIIDVEGVPTTCHSGVAPIVNAQRDAIVISRLRSAGALIIGKTALHEYATGGPSFDLPWPPARNPWDRNYHPGGSSSGSAVAVSARMVPAAIGTDTAGSVRHPATACGIVGFKPTFDAIETDGVFPLSWSLDQVGTLTRTASDAAILFDCLHDPRITFDLSEALSDSGISGKRIGVFEEFSVAAEPEIKKAFDDALDLFRELGAILIPLAVPPLAAYTGCGRLIIQAESYALHKTRLEAEPQSFGQRGRTRLLAGRSIDAASYINAQRLRKFLTGQLVEAMAYVDVAVTVSSLMLPCRIDDATEIDKTYDRQARTPFNLSGLPVVALPIGFSSKGLPIGMQIVGSAGADALVLNAARIYETSASWPMRPPILD